VQMGLERRRKLDGGSNGNGVGRKRKAGEELLPTVQRIIGRENGMIIVEEEEAIEGGGDTNKRTKHTFTLDESELLRIARTDRLRLKNAISQEKAASSAPKLPSFWIPSLTPSISTPEMGPVKVPKLQPVCPGSDPEHHHNYGLKSLVTLHFEEEDAGGGKEKARICPSCKKVLSNESKAVVTKPCGHILCLPCVKKFILHSDIHSDPHAAFTNGKPQRILCSICETDLTELTKEEKKKLKDKDKDKDRDGVKPGLVQISSDGTGFTAGGGKVLAAKETVAFQC